MVLPELMIKVIDFGDAYSPKVTPKYFKPEKHMFKYNPGKTLPFTSPEMFSRSNNLTGSQDIFSLGIMAFKMIFGTYPICCSETVLEKLYIEGSYTNRLFLAPEQFYDLGNIETQMILISFILKMLDPNEK